MAQGDSSDAKRSQMSSSPVNPGSGGHINSGGFLSSNNQSGNLEGNKEDRIAARRSRIETKRLQKLRPEENEVEAEARRKAKTDVDTGELGKSKAQIAQSRQRLETVKSQGNDLITLVRVSTDSRESNRRIDENKRVDVRSSKRNEEARIAEEEGKEIEKAWERSLTASNPYDLQEMLISQKKDCDDLIKSKDTLIADYQVELKNKDDEYVKELKKQAEEIDLLLERIEKHYKEYQLATRDELEQIEKSFMQERSELIEANIREVEALMEQRRQTEIKYMDERAERIEENSRQLEMLRVADAEEYNMVKIKLETDVQILEQQLQQMRATYQLNTEKLEYNFQVLKKRDDENTITINQQKRKITRLTDVQNSLKTKFAKQEKSFQQEYLALTEDYKRITEQFKELQKKYRHFQYTDAKRYREVWQMNEENARELMRKVLQADKIISEQQLGIKWQPPSEDLFNPELGSQLMETSQSPAMSPVPRGSPSPQDGRTNGRNNTTSEDDTADAKAAEKRSQLFAKLAAGKGSNKLVKRMLELLSNEAGFLVEEKLKKLLAPLQKDEQSLMKLDSIFKAIGIETVEDIEELGHYFVRDKGRVLRFRPLTPEEEETGVRKKPEDSLPSENADSVEAGPREMGPGEIVSSATGPELIHPNEVIKAIRAFLESHRKENNLGDFSSDFLGDVAEGGSFHEGSNVEGQASTTEKSKAELQREYWARMTTIIDDRTYRVWQAAFAEMEKYHEKLEKRSNLVQEIQTVRDQNAELKALLKQYLSAKINDELHIPPLKVLL